MGKAASESTGAWYNVNYFKDVGRVSKVRVGLMQRK